MSKSKENKKSKKKINSRAKGARGEREVAQLLRSYGYEARRGQQYSGSPDSPDVISSLEGFHIEVKRVEQFNLYKALEQCEKDRGEGEKSLIFHKKNGKPWTICMDANEFLQLIESLINEGI